ncbi:MAG: 5'-deoxynucleotidase [Lachnospiraceae bacterium]|nr:5'-deoxynucleotidase [Lachnospiraceae bacterium]
MDTYGFFAMMARLKWIDRWALMRNSSDENLSEHSLEAAMIAHALCVIGNERFGRKLNADRAAVIGMFHDASEILTGDMPTPVKYFNRKIRSAYKDIEQDANTRLLNLLPEDLRTQYTDVLDPGDDYSQEKLMVKGADKLSAYIKCIEERKAGNREFESAERSTLAALHEMNLPEVETFLEEFIPAYEKTLDEIRP